MNTEISPRERTGIFFVHNFAVFLERARCFPLARLMLDRLQMKRWVLSFAVQFES